VIRPPRRSVAVAACGLTVMGTTLVSVSPAWAAPPANDDRAAAVVVEPPATVTGTLVDATLEEGEPGCSQTEGSVWYSFTASDLGAVVVQLQAAGDLDASLDLFKRVRSRLELVACGETDAEGVGTLDAEGLEPGAEYVVRVARLFASQADTFQLKVLVPSPPPEPPGERLPESGVVRDQVGRALDPGDAYRTRLKAGRTMRLSLQSERCTSLEIHGPGTKTFSDPPVAQLPCGGYELFTPERTGRHYLVVRAERGRTGQRYELRIARARRDDVAPGLRLPNHSTVKGRVNGGIDARDLYRFDVSRRSAVRLSVRGGPVMTLVRDDGKGLGEGTLIDRTVGAGRYFVAVEGAGTYKLRRASGRVTRAELFFNGRRTATVEPGSPARLKVRVRPRVGGRAVISVEQFDPIDGWQFVKKYRPRVREGTAKVTFRPQDVGRYRALGTYKGTRTAAPDEARRALLRVQ